MNPAVAALRLSKRRDDNTTEMERVLSHNTNVCTEHANGCASMDRALRTRKTANGPVLVRPCCHPFFCLALTYFSRPFYVGLVDTLHTTSTREYE